LLDAEREIARLVTDAVWNTSRNLRDRVRIGKLARSHEDVNFRREIPSSLISVRWVIIQCNSLRITHIRTFF